jgi:hypothetical protein
MAIDVHRHRAELKKIAYQLPIHDLEGVFFVLLEFCTSTTGPRGEREPSKMGRSNGLQELFGATLTDVEAEYAHIKKSLFWSNNAFESKVLTQVTPYFKNFIPLLRELWGVIFGYHLVDIGTEVHDEILQIIRQFMDSAILDDESLTSDSMASYPNEQVLEIQSELISIKSHHDTN